MAVFGGGVLPPAVAATWRKIGSFFFFSSFNFFSFFILPLSYILFFLSFSFILYSPSFLSSLPSPGSSSTSPILVAKFVVPGYIPSFYSTVYVPLSYISLSLSLWYLLCSQVTFTEVATFGIFLSDTHFPVVPGTVCSPAPDANGLWRKRLLYSCVIYPIYLYVRIRIYSGVTGL